jgi:hypothetical protein
LIVGFIFTMICIFCISGTLNLLLSLFSFSQLNKAKGFHDKYIQPLKDDEFGRNYGSDFLAMIYFNTGNLRSIIKWKQKVHKISIKLMMYTFPFFTLTAIAGDKSGGMFFYILGYVTFIVFNLVFYLMIRSLYKKYGPPSNKIKSSEL